jgi:hypothetical protein
MMGVHPPSYFFIFRNIYNLSVEVCNAYKFKKKEVYKYSHKHYITSQEKNLKVLEGLKMKETKTFVETLIEEIKRHLSTIGDNEELKELKSDKERYINGAKVLVGLTDVANGVDICTALLSAVSNDMDKTMIQGLVMAIRQIDDQIRTMIDNDMDVKKLRVVLHLLESKDITIVDDVKPVENPKPVNSKPTVSTTDAVVEPELEEETDNDDGVARATTTIRPMRLTPKYRAIDFIPGMDPEKYAIMKDGTIINRYTRKEIHPTRFSKGEQIYLDKRKFTILNLLIKAYPDVYDENGNLLVEEPPKPEAPKPYVETHLPTSVDAERANDPDEERLPQEPLPIPYGYKPIDFYEGIDPVRYCINRDGLVIDRLDLINVEPVMNDGKLVIALKNKNGGFSSFIKARLVYQAFKTSNNVPNPEPLEDVPVPLIIPNTNIPEDKYTIKKDGTIFDNYHKRRLIPETDKIGIVRVELTGTIKPGNTNPTQYKYQVADLIKLMFPAFNHGTEGRVDITRITRPVEIDKPKSETAESLIAATTMPEAKDEPILVSATIPDEETRPIDFIDWIPRDKYRVYMDGRVYNNYTESFVLITKGKSATHRPTINLSNSKHKKGGPRLKEDGGSKVKTYCLDAIVWAAFMDTTSLEKKGSKPDHIDKRLNNCRITNLTLGGRRYKKNPTTAQAD